MNEPLGGDYLLVLLSGFFLHLGGPGGCQKREAVSTDVTCEHQRGLTGDRGGTRCVRYFSLLIRGVSVLNVFWVAPVLCWLKL